MIKKSIKSNPKDGFLITVRGSHYRVRKVAAPRSLGRKAAILRIQRQLVKSGEPPASSSEINRVLEKVRGISNIEYHEEDDDLI